MRILTWLFGKKEQAIATSEPGTGGSVASVTEKPAKTPKSNEKDHASEPENLRHWKEAGQPRAWVEARQGRWGHGEWLALLEELKRSRFWPMQADAIGAALEEARREWFRRN